MVRVCRQTRDAFTGVGAHRDTIIPDTHTYLTDPQIQVLLTHPRHHTSVLQAGKWTGEATY